MSEIKQIFNKYRKHLNSTVDVDKEEQIEKALIKELETLFSLQGVSNCPTWKPTMILRWYETDNYNTINDDFDKVLKQKWQSSEGEEKWEEIEVYGR